MIIAGTDETGLGALAGPIVAVTVAVDLDSIDLWPLAGIADSKTVSASKREKLREPLTDWLLDNEASVGISFVPVDYINSYGYAMAHQKALSDSVRQATKDADVRPDLLLIDGQNNISGYPWKQRAEPKADRNYFVVAAASIIAKILRDDEMRLRDEMYPEYGFASHKGYGTEEHKEALQRLGLSPIHRTLPCSTFLGGSRTEKSFRIRR